MEENDSYKDQNMDNLNHDELIPTQRSINEKSHRTDTLKSTINRINPLETLKQKNKNQEQEISYWKSEFDRLKNEVIINTS